MWGRSSFDVTTIVGLAAAVLLARWFPAVALALVWVVFGLQMVTAAPFNLAELAVAYVAFACTRWGSTGTIIVSGVSIPLAVVMAASLTVIRPYLVYDLAFQLLQVNALRTTYGVVVAALVLVGAVLVVPWIAGLAVRATDQARSSQASREVAEQDAHRAHREADQAREIATLRDEQAQLARDVHDVVGHSLAVILAQAESAQYLPDDPARLKQTLATIVTSARDSLGSVRDVLDGAASPGPGDVRAATDPLQQLVAGVRASGREVLVEEEGLARPLPPELAVAAERVLQEMLTNAVKHGRRDQPIHVERHWPDDAYGRDLRLEVSNAVAGGDHDDTQPLQVAQGRGLEGMTRRLEAVGGRFDVRRRTLPEGGSTFTVTAWVPVRG